MIDNYAPTAKASVTVVDADGKPVDNACVEFKLYNYAEFYTVAVKHTDAKGTCGLTAGKGDMLVWASKDGRFGFAKLSFGKQQELTVCLDKKEGGTFAVDIDIVPPPETANLPGSYAGTACGERPQAGAGGFYTQCLYGNVHDGRTDK